MTPHEQEMASDSILRRIRIMAEFIANDPQRLTEFGKFWKEKFPGKATAEETIDFMGRPNLEDQWRIWMVRKDDIRSAEKRR